jgi:hypothetical protein
MAELTFAYREGTRAGGLLLNSPGNAICRTSVLGEALILAERPRLYLS